MGTIKIKLKDAVFFVNRKQFQLTDLLDGVGYKYDPEATINVYSDVFNIKDDDKVKSNEQTK